MYFNFLESAERGPIPKWPPRFRLDRASEPACVKRKMLSTKRSTSCHQHRATQDFLSKS